MSTIFSDHNNRKLEINDEKKTGKFTNTWRLNDVLVDNQQVKGELKEKFKTKYLETNPNVNTTYQNLF